MDSLAFEPPGKPYNVILCSHYKQLASLYIIKWKQKRSAFILKPSQTCRKPAKMIWKPCSFQNFKNKLQTCSITFNYFYCIFPPPPPTKEHSLAIPLIQTSKSGNWHQFVPATYSPASFPVLIIILITFYTVKGFSPESHIAFSCHWVLVSAHSVTVSLCLSLTFMTLIFLIVASQSMCRISLIWACQLFPHD